MYDAGRPMTMMEVNHWPSILSEQDTPAPSPNPQALTVPSTSGRVQIQVQHKPSTLNTAHPMAVRLLTCQIGKQTSMKQSQKCVASPMQRNVSTQALAFQ